MAKQIGGNPSHGQLLIAPCGTVALPWALNYPAATNDSFGRPRTSSPKTFFNSDFEYDINPLWFQSSTVGTGAVAKTTGISSLTLTTGGTAAGAGVIYQTKQYFRYEPGKGRFVVFSGYIGAQANNCRQRIGNFDANNGVFFEMDGTVGMSVNQRSNTSGSVVDMKVLQANWNGDRLDGTGPSGINLDFSKTQLMWIDFQWMGTGHTRFGFFCNGFMLVCHEIYNDNIITVPYTNTACLPLRAEIFNTGVTSSVNTLEWTCSSLANEGSPEIAPSYLTFSADNSWHYRACPVGTKTPVVSIRPTLLFAGQTNRIHFLMNTLSVLSLTNHSFWQLIYNGDLTGASFSSVDPNSGASLDTSATSIAGGTIVASGWAAAAQMPTKDDLKERLAIPFTLDINGANPDTYTIVAAGIGATSNVLAGIDWLELR